MRTLSKALVCLLSVSLPKISAESQVRTHVAPSHRPPASRSRCAPVVLVGDLRRGETYRKRFARDLDLLVEAAPSGWLIRIVPSAGARPEIDFAELATPPFRSINPLRMTTEFGLRAQDVVGWNPRRFRYLESRQALPEALRAYRADLSSSTPTPAQQSAVARVAGEALEGTLEIVDAVLVPGTADQSAAAALLATHFNTTAHTIEASDVPGQRSFGEIRQLRFRATLSQPGGTACEGR